VNNSKHHKSREETFGKEESSLAAAEETFDLKSKLIDKLESSPYAKKCLESDGASRLKWLDQVGIDELKFLVRVQEDERADLERDFE